jgi:Domain of unknown function (DUF4331)/FlgD Ig-like domain
MKNLGQMALKATTVIALVGAIGYYGAETRYLEASSHREAPLIAEDPIADNTDLYAFRSPDNPNTVTIIANYIGLELPQGGPNYATFGEDVRYEIHIKKNPLSFGDDLVYRFTFKRTNEDPTTFFNIRLGKQNLKTTYMLERRFGNNGEWQTVVTNGVVPPPNIGPRSIDNATLGLGKPYAQIMREAVTTAPTGERIFCGPSDDPFFVDLGGIFDLGQTRQDGGARDGVGCYNVHAIALQIPIQLVQKDFKAISEAKNILDGDYIIGVWASASRPRIRTLQNAGAKAQTSGDWVQVSRLGMPLTNEAVIPIGQKDKWNFYTPYDREERDFEQYFTNPELGLYMDDRLFGGAVPAFSKLRTQTASKTVLGAVDFGNGKDGLFVIKGHPALAGTALADAAFGNYLLRRGAPRSVDVLPAFYTGVPNLPPYQLATGKTPGNPLTVGKPFINNFIPAWSLLPNDLRFGDMLRLNLAVPPTPRNDPRFSSEGLIAAAVLGLTDTAFNKSNAMQFIPNMDGFPNGRRLEDDVTRIELQAVSGAVLAAVGLWYDDWNIGQSPLTPKLLNVLTYTTGVEKNDKAFQTSFPYVAAPHSGFGACGGVPAGTVFPNSNLVAPNFDNTGGSKIGLSSPAAMLKVGQNPFREETTLAYHLAEKAQVSVLIYDLSGRLVQTLENEKREAGDYQLKWEANNVPTGTYIARVLVEGQPIQTAKLVKVK